MVVGLVLVAVGVMALAWWAFCAISRLGALIWWARGVWADDAPGELGDRLRRWLAPRWHYPFVGAGSIVASVLGALAVQEIVSGADPAAPPALVLVCVFLRSVWMAWFPWPRTQPAGLRVYPLVVVTGPLASALGMLAVWVLVLGGQMLSSGGHRWLALSSVPLAVLIVLLATLIGRIGRTLIPCSAPNRLEIYDLLTTEAIDRGKELALSCSPLAEGRSTPPALAAKRQAGNGSPCIHGGLADPIHRALRWVLGGIPALTAPQSEPFKTSVPRPACSSSLSSAGRIS